jgi:NitT/TauT family transport system substrate-binding protein
MFPTVDRNVGLQQIHEIDKLLVDSQMRDKPVGFLRQDRMQETATFVDRAFELHGKVKATDLYTDAFVK